MVQGKSCRYPIVFCFLVKSREADLSLADKIKELLKVLVEGYNAKLISEPEKDLAAK